MSATHMLGPATTRISDTEPDAKQTVFGRFLLAIKSGQTTTQSFADATRQWVDEPVDLIVLSGLWVLMHKIASVVGKPMTTSLNVQVVGERVNRLVTAGMILSGKTPEQLASDFHRDVIVLTRRAHVLGYCPGMSIALPVWKLLLAGNEDAFQAQLPKSHGSSSKGGMLEYWQGPTTLFFAPFVKNARALMVSLQERVTRLNRDNVVMQSGHTSVYRSKEVDEAVVFADETLKYLDETRSGPKLPPRGLETIEGYLKMAEQAMSALTQFRPHADNWTSLQHSVHLDYEWLNTQILLAQTEEGSDEDVLQSLGTYLKALKRVKRSLRKACDGTLARLGSRRDIAGRPLLHRETLVRLIMKNLEQMNKWDVDAVSDQALTAIIVVAGDQELLMDPASALSIATGQERGQVDHMHKQGQDARAWLSGVALAILWAELSKMDLEDILKHNVLPPGDIVDGLVLCKKNVREIGVQALLDKGDGKTISLLVRMNLIELDHELIEEHVAFLDSALLDECLVDMCRYAGSPQGELFITTFWKMLGYTNKKSAKALLQNMSLRTQLCTITTHATSGSGLTWIDFDRVRNNLGNDVYNQLILGSIAQFLQILRQEEGLDDEEDPPWNHAFKSGSGGYVPLRVLGPNVTQEEASALLEQTSEETALAWAGIKTS